MKANNIFFTTPRRILGLTIGAGVLMMCCALSAQTTDGSGGPPPPPPEALASCKSLTSGNDCSFTSPQGKVAGTCWAPEGKPLACKPKDAPAGGPTPPKQ